MKTPFRWAAAATLVLATATVAAQTPTTDDEKVSYTIGFLVADALVPFELTEAELDMVIAGLRAKVTKSDPSFDPVAYRDQVLELRNERVQLILAKQREESQTYLDELAAKPGAERTDSGLIYQEVESGSGASPAATDTVVVHYVGTLRNGTTFDSSRQRGQPATFPLNGVIPCWTEGLQKMKVGGRATLTCPPEIGYGDAGSPPKIPGGSVLVFDVELISIDSGNAGQ